MDILNKENIISDKFDVIVSNPPYVISSEKKHINKKYFCHFLVWIQDSRHFQPVLGRKFHVESEFEVEHTQFWDPEGKK